MIWLESVRVCYRDGPSSNTALAIDSLELKPASLVAIVGPNGAGKSTLLSVLAGLQSSYEGSCYCQGREIRNWPRRELARILSFVPQQVDLSFPFTAEEIVLMGRTPFGSGLFESANDRSAVQRAMAMTDTTAFRFRDFRTLSGGERQRVILASALAQQPRALLLDEPTTFLDLKHQLAIFELLRRMADEEGLLVVSVTHDLRMAARFASRTVILHEGRIAGDNARIDPGIVRRVFEVDPALFLPSA